MNEKSQSYPMTNLVLRAPMSSLLWEALSERTSNDVIITQWEPGGGQKTAYWRAKSFTTKNFVMILFPQKRKILRAWKFSGHKHTPFRTSVLKAFTVVFSLTHACEAANWLRKLTHAVVLRYLLLERHFLRAFSERIGTMNVYRIGDICSLSRA